MTKYKRLMKLIVLLALLSTAECGRRGGEDGNRPSFVTGGSLFDMINKLYPDRRNKTMETTTLLPDDFEFDTQNIDYNPMTSSEVARNVMDLSQRIAMNILSDSNKKFEVFSPISISAALHLALLGANGQTFNELMQVIGYNSKTPTNSYHRELSLILDDLTNNDSTRRRKPTAWKRQFYDKFAEQNRKNSNEILHQISIANGIFIQQGYSIRPDYKSAVESVYKSELRTLDFHDDAFGATKYINDWVNTKTNGKIKQLINGAINPETKVVLANALYFKALWLQTFIKGATMTRRFYPDGVDGRFVDVKLMAHGGKFPYYNDDECDVAVMGFPYQLNITTMYVFLPNQSNRRKLIEAQKCLTATKIEQMIDNMTRKSAVVLFPKMHLTGGFNLKSTLRKLGLEALFRSDQCDLSLLSDGSELMRRKMSSASRMPVPMKHEEEDAPLMPPKGDDTDNVDDKFYFSRFGGSTERKSIQKRHVTYKVASQDPKKVNHLRLKDFVLRKRIVKEVPGKKMRRIKRQIDDPLSNIERARIENKRLVNPNLYATDVIHKVDLTINERGTEGGAATAITLNRSGTNVVFRVDTPFMILIRHDPTRIPLFYGAVFEPTDEE